jgi:nucleoside-triphosphatase THEP1
VGRYQVDVTSFETIALPALEYISTKTPVVPSKGRGNDSPKILENVPKEKPGPKTTSAYLSNLETGVKYGKQDELPVQPHSRNCLVVIDEIGKMELFSKSFVESVEGLFENLSNEGRVVLATIPVAGRGKSHRLLEELRNRRDCRLFQVTEKNRDSLVQDISQFVLQRLTAAQ